MDWNENQFIKINKQLIKRAVKINCLEENMEKIEKIKNNTEESNEQNEELNNEQNVDSTNSENEELNNVQNEELNNVETNKQFKIQIGKKIIKLLFDQKDYWNFKSALKDLTAEQIKKYFIESNEEDSSTYSLQTKYNSKVTFN